MSTFLITYLIGSAIAFIFCIICRIIADKHEEDDKSITLTMTIFSWVSIIFIMYVSYKFIMHKIKEKQKQNK